MKWATCNVYRLFSSCVSWSLCHDIVAAISFEFSLPCVRYGKRLLVPCIVFDREPLGRRELSSGWLVCLSNDLNM